MRATDQWHGLREDMARTRHTCPQDGASMGLTDVFAQDANGDVPQGAEPYRALVCPECSFTVPVAVIIERAKRQAEPLKKTERALVLFGFTILVLFSVIAFLNSNFLTLIGATIMALMFSSRHCLCDTSIGKP
ncbi:MAG: hypothetical protein HC844_04390 [Tabrizicola sp.]|nr:hypothetical protein [Tabrizicola sp.]